MSKSKTSSVRITDKTKQKLIKIQAKRAKGGKRPSIMELIAEAVEGKK